MALSNIFREPRREITESLVGFSIFLLPLYLDYRFSLFFEAATTTPGKQDYCPWPLGMVVGAFAIAFVFFALMGIAYGTHAAGEGICNVLAARGLELRPRNRR